MDLVWNFVTTWHVAHTLFDLLLSRFDSEITNVAITRLTAQFACGILFALVICKLRKEYTQT